MHECSVVVGCTYKRKCPLCSPVIGWYVTLLWQKNSKHCSMIGCMLPASLLLRFSSCTVCDYIYWPCFEQRDLSLWDSCPWMLLLAFIYLVHFSEDFQHKCMYWYIKKMTNIVKTLKSSYSTKIQNNNNKKLKQK